jgi:hypothetical protein
MHVARFLTAALKKSASHAEERRESEERLAPECVSSLEKLETRLTLSVTIKVANQDILISGDGTNNHIAVFQDGGGNLFIYGDSATSIAGDGVVSAAIPDTNAGGGREFNSGLFKNIFVNFGNGNDTVEFGGLRAADVQNLTINTGDASTGDTVKFGQTTFVGNPDTNWGSNAIAHSVDITTGNGADQVRISDLTTPAFSVQTGSGDDTITPVDLGGLVSNVDKSIDGGAGNDTLVFAGAGQPLNLTTLASGQLAQIEHIDLTGTGDGNTLTVDATSVLALSPTTKTLTVNGTAGDLVTIGAGWDTNPDQMSGGTTYKVFTQKGATLKIANTLSLSAALQVFTIDAKHPVTFADANHDAVTVKLTGIGSATMTLNGSVANGADIHSFALTGTDAKSAVSITVKKDKLTGDGLTTIGGVTADSVLKSFTAKAADLTGTGFSVTGAVKAITLHDFLAGNITTGGAATDKLALTFGMVAAGTTIDTQETISTLKAVSVGHGSILTNAIGSIGVSAGAFAADITSIGAIGKITVKGGGLTGSLSATSFGAISITGGDFSGSLTSLTPAATLGKTKALPSLSVTGGDLTGDVRVLGTAGTISVKGVKGGAGGNVSGATVVASAIAGLNVAGNFVQSIVLAGADLGADHAFGGGNDVFATGSLGAVKISGNVTTGSVIAAGLSTTNATLKDGDDTIVGAAASIIKSFTVAGTADANSYFVAGNFASAPKIGGMVVDPGTDGRFKTLV